MNVTLDNNAEYFNKITLLFGRIHTQPSLKKDVAQPASFRGLPGCWSTGLTGLTGPLVDRRLFCLDDSPSVCLCFQADGGFSQETGSVPPSGRLRQEAGE